MSPAFLSNLLPPYVSGSSRYPLRNSHDFIIPRTSKNVRLSFLWHTLYDWNSLDLDVRHSSSTSVLKSRLKTMLFYSTNPLFNIYTPKSSIHHARMRMGLSALNAHRKKYNFINHNKCPLCGQIPEDTIHLFLKCPFHAIHRASLMRAISTVMRLSLPSLNLTPRSMYEFRALTDVFLYGSNLLSFDENGLLFKAVHTFIYDSKRFDIT